jgi:hypothetical protein
MDVADALMAGCKNILPQGKEENSPPPFPSESRHRNNT